MKARRNALAVSPSRSVKSSSLGEHPSVTRRKATARNTAIDLVVRNKVCNCDAAQGKHSKDCDLVQPDKLLPRDHSVMIQTVIHHVQPQHGDVVILALKEPVPERQLRMFRRGLYAYSQEHEKTTGAKIQYLVINSEVSVHHLTREQRLELLHENQVVLDKDGSLIETIRAIGEDEA